MASGKLSPRQKMINLMYLVFIAMLAMNMSKEVLSAFGFLNEKLEKSIVTATEKNTMAYEGLAGKASEQAEKYKVLNEKADSIKVLSVDLFDHIESIKKLIREDVEDPTNYESMDKPDFLDVYFFRKGKITPEGQLFLDKMAALKNGVASILGDRYPAVTESVNQRFNTDDVTDREGVKKSWIEYNFIGFPAIASLTKLSQIQTDIKITESEILSAMLQGQLQSDVSMKNYKAIVIPDKTAFFQGENFTGKVVLGRYDASLKPSQVVVNGREITKIENGGALLEFPSGSVGDREIKGKFVFMENGKPVEIPIESSYAVIPKPNSAVISADKMNVVYRGVPNPMTISIPGIPNINATGVGLKKIRGAQYVMTPGSGREVLIKVSGKLPDGTPVNFKQKFRIKDIPSPRGTIRKQEGYVKMPKTSLANATVGAALPDFDFDLKLKTTSFTVKVPGQSAVVVRGSRMNAQAKKAISKARRGDVITIFDIKSSLIGNNSYKIKPASAVSIEIQ